MTINVMYIMIFTEDPLDDDETNQLINDTFVREFQEGRPWGKVIQEVVQKDVDLGVKRNIYYPIKDETVVAFVARDSFKSSNPNINLDSHTNFYIMNTYKKSDKVYKAFLFFVLA